MPELESALEKDCVGWAKDHGWFEFKIMRANKKGIPDRFFAKDARPIFVEFKRLGKEARVQQERHIRELREQGIECFVIDNREDFYAALA